MTISSATRWPVGSLYGPGPRRLVMKKDPRRYWPSRAVNVVKLLRALGIESPDDTACPSCSRGKLRISYTRRSGTSAFSAGCTQCTVLLDPVTLSLEIKKFKGTHETVEWMDSVGALTSNRARSTDAVNSYLRHCASFIAFQHFRNSVCGRIPGRAFTSDAHASLGICEKPHGIDYWTAMLGEIDEMIGRNCDPQRSLYIDTHANKDTAAVVIPLSNRSFGTNNLVGMWISASTYPNGRNRWVWRGVIDGPAGVWPPQHSVEDKNYAVTFDPDDLVPATLVHMIHDTGGMKCRTALVSGPVDEIPSLLGEYDNRKTCVYHTRNSNSDIDTGIRLAAKLDCRIIIMTGPASRFLDGESEGLWWERHIHTAHHTDPGIVDWDEATAHRAVALGRLMPDEAVEVSARVGRFGHKSPEARTIPIRRGLTLSVEARGWVWAEKGVLLTAAPPIVTRIYRIPGSKRIGYEGYVAYDNKIHRFNSALFKKDASGVVDKALLLGGAVPPPVHPAIAPHTATVALYLMKR